MRLNRDSIVERFHGYGGEAQLIGGEFERLVVHADGRPLEYDEPQGVRWLLEQLTERFGWEAQLEKGRPIALLRDGASTTLEPGGQVELSGRPHESVLGVAEEAMASMGELRTLFDGTDVHLVALGLTPYARIEDINFVPKGRYALMGPYLAQRGDMAHHMMKGTSSFQANFDFRDEADCAKKVDMLTALAPLTTAMFANSPMAEGRDTGLASARALSWTRCDPDRCGVPAVLRQGYSHEAWVDYLLDVPMMFLKSEGAWADPLGRSFRYWMDRGIDGAFPTWDDWSLHETSVFPEVRVKRTIEVRGADACPLPIALGGIALWTALLYDEGALDEAGQLAREFASHGTHNERFMAAVERGLHANVGRPYAEWARDLVAIGAAGLGRSRPSERALLEPIEAMTTHGDHPGVAVSRIFAECTSPARCLRRVLY
jgi:glutamate--cysteine ligase